MILFHHTARLAFVVLLFGAAVAAPVPPQPDARLALHHDEVRGGSGVTAAVPLVLEARANSRFGRVKRAIGSHKATAVKYRAAAAAWRKYPGSHPDWEKKAKDLESEAKSHEKMVKDPSSLHTDRDAKASEAAAKEKKKLAEAALKEANENNAKYLEKTGAPPEPPAKQRLIFDKAVAAHINAAATNRDTARAWRMYSQHDRAAREKADDFDKIAEGHEKSAKNPEKGYTFVTNSLAAAHKSTKKALKSNKEAVKHNEQFKSYLFGVAVDSSLGDGDAASAASHGRTTP